MNHGESRTSRNIQARPCWVLEYAKEIHHKLEEYEAEKKQRNKRESAEEDTEWAGEAITLQTRIQ